MQLLNSNVALISNCEVSRLLAEEAQYLDQQDEVFGNVDKSLRAFQSKVSHYLQPFEKLPDSAVQAFLQSVPSYGLTAAELLNILNIRPKSYCHLCTIVEESEERLSGKKLDSLLHLCQKHLTLEGEAVAPAGLPLEGLQDALRLLLRRGVVAVGGHLRGIRVWAVIFRSLRRRGCPVLEHVAAGEPATDTQAGLGDLERWLGVQAWSRAPSPPPPPARPLAGPRRLGGLVGWNSPRGLRLRGRGLPASRRVQVLLDGLTVAEGGGPRLFSFGLHKLRRREAMQHQLQKHHTDAAVYDALFSADARFSAVSYKLAVPKCICHVFADGTINMSGVKTAADIDHAVAQITEIVGKHVGTPKDGDEASLPSKSNRGGRREVRPGRCKGLGASAVGLGGR